MKRVSLRHDMTLMGLMEASGLPYRSQADYEMRDRELNDPLYHISPATNRDAIQKFGLTLHAGKNLARGHKYAPATYAINCTRRQDPFDFFGNRDLRNTHDLWAIDRKGLNITWWHDANYPPDEQGYVLTTEHIPASHLRLVKRAELHEAVTQEFVKLGDGYKVPLDMMRRYINLVKGQMDGDAAALNKNRGDLHDKLVVAALKLKHGNQKFFETVKGRSVFASDRWEEEYNKVTRFISDYTEQHFYPKG